MKKQHFIFLLFFSYLFIFPAEILGMDSNKKGKSAKKMVLPSETEYLLGQFKASRHPDFRKVKADYSDGPPHYLRKEAADAFEKMAADAKKERIKLRIVSGFRSFDYQKMIWEEKFNGFREVENQNLNQVFLNNPAAKVLKILRYSAAPGSSRHHWGTDMDLNSVESAYFKTKEGQKIYDWLKTNARNYGFFQPYSPGRKNGYQDEEWHWSYFPISSSLLKKFTQTISPEMIQGFKGDDHLPQNFYEDYILGIAHEPS